MGYIARHVAQVKGWPRWLRWMTALLLLLLLGAGSVAGAVVYLSRDLPDVQAVRNYRPSQVTQIYADNNELIGQFYVEKRLVVPLSRVSKPVWQAIIAVEDSAGHETHPLVHVDIPRATFCTPNVGSFGLTEEQAREQGYDVVIGKVPYGAVGGGTVYGDRTGLVKLVGDRTYGELLGGHIVGSRATEMIQELVNIRALEGGFPELARIIHGHPTLSEAVMEAGRAADGWLIHG